MKPALSTLIAAICLICQPAAAQDTSKKLKSKVTQATVYLHGAEVTHAAAASLAKGDNEIEIEGLSPQIDTGSLKIKASNGVIVNSFEFSTDNKKIKSPDNARIKVINDSIAGLNDRLAKLLSEMEVDTRLKSMLETSINLNINDTLPIADLQKVMDYYRSKAVDLNFRKLDNDRLTKALKDSISDLNRRLQTVSQAEYQQAGLLRLVLWAPLAVSCHLEISYYTDMAKWTPCYDINIASMEKPIDIAVKARVKQTTAVDWEKVKLTISSATPSHGKQAPLFKTWWLGFREAARTQHELSAPLMQNSISYEDTELNEVVVMAYGSSSKVRVRGANSVPIENQEPLYVLNGEVVSKEEAEQIDVDMIKSIDVLKDGAATSIYGARAMGGVVVITTKSSPEDFVSENDSIDFNFTYNIDLPYSIPGDGKEQTISLQSKQAQADFKYYCAPKLDPAVFLIADIAGWEKLNLLGGEANVTYNETYLGKTRINPLTTFENLSLTLGADSRVSVKRELLRNFSSKKTMGTAVKHTFAYRLTARNNLNRTAHFVLKEQYPLSTNKDIKVQLLEKETTTPSVNRKDLGVITWEADFAPAEIRTYQITYTIEYPSSREGSVNLK